MIHRGMWPSGGISSEIWEFSQVELESGLEPGRWKADLCSAAKGRPELGRIPSSRSAARLTAAPV